MQISGKAAIYGHKLGLILGEDGLRALVENFENILVELDNRDRLQVYKDNYIRALAAALLEFHDQINVITEKNDCVTYEMTARGQEALARLNAE